MNSRKEEILMRKSALYVSIVMMSGIILFGSLFGQEDMVDDKGQVGTEAVTVERVEHEVEFKLIKEGNTGTDVAYTYFGQKEDEKSGFPRIAIERSTAADVSNNKSVLFYDDNFNLIFEHLGSYAYVSKSANYVCLRREEGEGPRGYPQKSIFELYDNGGALIWSKEQPFTTGSSEGFIVADNGLVVGFHPGVARLSFYNEHGEEVKHVDIFKDMKWTEREGFYSDFSVDGRYFAVTSTCILQTFQEPVQTTYTSVAIMYTTQGEELWRFHQEDNNAQMIAVSPFGDYVALSNYHLDSDLYSLPKRSRVCLLSGEGKVIRNYDDVLPYRKTICFSSSGKYLALNNKSERVYLIKTETGDIILDFTVPEGKKVFAIDIAEKGELIGLIVAAESSMGFIMSPQVLIVDHGGDLIWSNPLLYTNRIEEGRNLAIRISDSGNEISVGWGNKIYRFSQAQTED